VNERTKTILAGVGIGLAVFGPAAGAVGAATDNWLWAIPIVVLGALVGIRIGMDMWNRRQA